jgi:alanine dehydrogenase
MAHHCRRRELTQGGRAQAVQFHRSDIQMILISEHDIQRYVTFGEVLAAIERAFISLHQGSSSLFDVVRGHGGGADHFFAIKSARDGSIPLLGLKAGSYAPENNARGLPAHSSTTLLIDDRTGMPIAAVEAGYLNGLRTSAANALAVRALARPDATTLGIIGVGAQAVFEALAVLHVRHIAKIYAAGRTEQGRDNFIRSLRQHTEVAVEFVDGEAAARRADILVTVTPARAPVVNAEWIRQGTHISAMGADDVGKQELPVELTAAAQLWVDHPEQAARIGEAQHIYRAGRTSLEQLRERTLGRLLAEAPSPESRNDRITVFDSSGLAIQDIAAAHAAMTSVMAARARSGI